MPGHQPRNQHNDLAPSLLGLIPLKSLFNYSMTSNTNAGTSLDLYWKGGSKNMNWELAADDLLCEESFPDEDGVADVIDGAGLTY